MKRSNNNSMLYINKYVKDSYAELLLYYYKTGIGKKSEVAGALITESLIKTIETRYKQLGGDPSELKLKMFMPSMNGTAEYEN